MPSKTTSRPWISDAAVDARERAWWDAHAELIAAVWEMPPSVSWAIRRGYLQDAKRFLAVPGHSATVLELGCGSGWVGQSIAGPELRILGTDFSGSQIRLATDRARRRGLSSWCCYRVADTGSWSNDLAEVNGVLIHAFLHHLNGFEIDGILETLAKGLRRGARLWLLEPAFHLTAPASPASPLAPTRRWLRAAYGLHGALSRLYRRFDLLDNATYRSFLALAEDAERNGWYLSPKEVPLELESFHQQLARHFEVRAHRWASVYRVGWTVETALVKNGWLRGLIARGVLPWFARADQHLARDEAYLRSILVAPNHAFHVWECEA